MGSLTVCTGHSLSLNNSHTIVSYSLFLSTTIVFSLCFVNKSRKIRLDKTVDVPVVVRICIGFRMSCVFYRIELLGTFVVVV